MPRPAHRRAALAGLALLTLIWGVNWVVMKQALQFAGPFAFSAWRYALGTLVLALALALRGGPFRPPPLIPTFLIGLGQTAIFQALVQWALVGGGAGKTALLAYTMPFWVVLLNWLLLAERPGRMLQTCLALAVGGLALVIGPLHGELASSLAATGGGLAWSLGVVLSKRLFEREHVDPLALTAWQMLVGAILLIVLATAVPERPTEWNRWFLGALAYNAILSSGLGWLLWSWVVARLPAAVAGLASLAVPLAGIGFAWALLGERPSPREALGMVLVASALVLVNRGAGTRR